MAVTQELAGVGEKKFLQWYFQHKNIHEVNLQPNRTNFKSLSTLPLRIDQARVVVWTRSCSLKLLWPTNTFQLISTNHLLCM